MSINVILILTKRVRNILVYICDESSSILWNIAMMPLFQFIRWSFNKYIRSRVLQWLARDSGKELFAIYSVTHIIRPMSHSFVFYKYTGSNCVILESLFYVKQYLSM